jgi:predicted transcriptional regulator
MRPSLAAREAELMNVIWDHGPSTVSEVQALLKDKLAYTSVQTTLRMLEGKGYIGHSEDGRAHRYHALVDRAAAQEGAIKTLIARLFKGSSDALLTHLVSHDKLSVKQLQRIEEEMRKAKRTQKP